MGMRQAVAAAVGVLLVLPATALASTVVVATDPADPTKQVVTWTGDGASDLVDVDDLTEDGDTFYFTFFATPLPPAPPACSGTNPMRCQVSQQARFVMVGNGGNDELDVQHLPPAAAFPLQDGPVSFDGGAGKSKRFKVSKNRAAATQAFKGRRLGLGASVEVRITAPDRIGKVLRYTMRSRKLPSKRELCLTPGKAKPGRCS